MTCSRRDFLKNSATTTLASTMPLSAFVFLTTEEAKAAVEKCEGQVGIPGLHNKMRGMRTLRHRV